jgi:transcriptional regulator with XRE-family HTH domain
MVYAMDILGTTGKRVRALRFDLGLTQQQLAATANLASSYLSRIEADQIVGVRSDIVRRLAKVLGTTTDYLLLAIDELVRGTPDRALLHRTFREIRCENGQVVSVTL